ncbi:MAG: CCA tRNA nucleotidyltransferase, partial [Acidimicrobiia bacterium]
MSTFPARLQPLFDPAAPVQQLARRLADAGHDGLLVGGTVRDAFLDRPHADIDLATSAHPDVIEAVVRPIADHVWMQGKLFGTVGCELDGVRIEVTTFRAEVYRSDSRKPSVVFADDVVTD